MCETQVFVLVLNTSVHACVCVCCYCQCSARNVCRTATHGPHERRPPTAGRRVFALMTGGGGGGVVQEAVVQERSSGVLQCETAVLGLEILFVYYDCSSTPAPPHPRVWLQGMLASAARAAAGPPSVDGPDKKQNPAPMVLGSRCGVPAATCFE